MTRIYLEYDDRHNEPIIHDYDSVEEAVRRVVGERPTIDEKSVVDGGPLYRDRHGKTAAEWLAVDVAEYERKLAEFMGLFDEGSDNYHGTYYDLDEYTWVDAGTMEQRAREAQAIADDEKATADFARMTAGTGFDHNPMSPPPASDGKHGDYLAVTAKPSSECTHRDDHGLLATPEGSCMLCGADLRPGPPKLFFLDNEYQDFVVLASSPEQAWEKLKAQHMILRPNEEVHGDYSAAYHDLYEVPAGDRVDNPHDLVFVL